MKKNFILLTAFLAFINLVFFNSTLKAQTNQSNITISTAATSGGSFTGTAPARVFTITADNAVINATALVTELLTNNVTISTARTGGTEAGNIIFSSAVTAASTGTTQRTFTVNAGGTITVNALINLTPATPTGNTTGRPASNINMTATGAITFSGSVNSSGGKASNATFGGGADGGNAGNINITTAGNFTNTGAINSNGGSGVTGLVSSRDGGDGGTVTINASSINISSTITTTGGGSTIVGNGGDAGVVTLNAANTLNVVAAITANGGNGVSAPGADLFLTGNNGITLTSNLTATGGGVGTAGSLTINDGAAIVTSAGTNDGQTASSVINVNNFTKNGVGTFNIAGTNSYVGNTNINAGIVRVSAAVNTGASTNGALGNNGLLGIATITITNAGLEFNNATFTRAITLTGNTTLNAFGAARSVTPALSGTGTLTVGANTVLNGAGQDLTLGGVISGSIALVKSFSSVLTLPATNTFTGAKTLNAGTLNLNNSNALGTIAATFTIAGGTLDNTTAAAITTLNYVQTWSGDFIFTGTQSLNLGTGNITMSASRNITVVSNTLTTGGIINAPTFSLAKLGAGSLAQGTTAKTFNNLSIGAGTFISTSGLLSIAGNFSNNGAFTHNSGTVRFNGTTQSISGSSVTAFNILTIITASTTTGAAASTATTFNINNGAKYIQQSGTTIPGTTKNFVLGSTYELQAAGVTFTGSTYGNLIINFTSGNTNASGNLTTVLNDLVIKNTGSGSFRLSANTSPVVTIAGNLRIDAGTFNIVTGTGTPSLTINGDVVLNGGNFQPMTSTGVASIFVKGNWVNIAATFTPGTSTVDFNSTTAPQNISGLVPLVFYNLTNSNTDFSGLSSDGDITVTNVLSFSSASNGVFSTGSNTVFVSNSATAAIQHPGTGYVVGNLKRSVAPAGGTFNFPVGSFLGYTPVSLNFNNGNTAGDVNVTTADGVSANYPATLSAIKQLARTWTITNAGGGSFNADGIFTFLPDDLLNAASDMALKGYKFNSPTSYVYAANTSNISNSLGFNGITSFGEFGAGECTGDLAVNGIVTNVTCNSGTNGSITTIVTGNTSTFTYLWNTTPAQTTANLSALSAGFYNVLVTEETTCSASNSFEVTEPAAIPAPVSGGNQIVCSDGTITQTLTATATSPVTVNWYDAAVGGNLVAAAVQTGVGTSTYYAEAFDGTCSSLTRTAVTLLINAVPNPPASGGNQSVCSTGSPSQTLTATATGGTVTWYDAATNGNVVANPQQVGTGSVTYYASSFDGTCNSLTRTAVTLTINPAPAAPVAANQTVCSNGSPTQTLTATATGGIITWYDAATGGNIIASPTQVGVGASTYYAAAFDGTCNSLSRTAVTLTINIAPVTPGPVAGPANACPYIGTGEQITYSIDPVAYAESYQWTLPSTVTYVSGQGTTSITITINTGFDANPNPVTRLIRVKALSACGNSADRLLYILAQYPSTPGAISGPTDICALIGTGNTATYTISKVIAATSYAWSAQSGTTTITHPNGPGINDTTISVTFAPGYTSGSITVAAVNGCGTSGSVRSLFIPRNASSTPGLITGTTNVCANILPNGTAAIYSVVPVPGATSYTWSVPAGSVVTHPNGAGANDYNITIQYPVGFTSGIISVSSTNGCGTSASRSLAVNKLNPATPGVIDVIQTVFCGDPAGRTYTYTISSLPANANTVQWTVPTNAGAVLVSGQGTTSITVSYPSTAVTGNITAQSINNCGSSTIRSTAVRLAACPPPGFTKQTGKTINDYSLITGVQTMEVKIFPNPTVSDFKLQVLTAGREKIHVRILDLQGREFKSIIVMPYETTTIGADLKTGAYVVEIIQGKNKTTQKLLKF